MRSLRKAEEADEAVAEAVAEVGSRGGLRRLMRLWLRRLRRQRRLRRRGRSLSLGTSLPFCTLSSLSQGEAPEGIPEVGDWGEAPEGIPAGTSTRWRSFSLCTLLSFCTLSSALTFSSSFLHHEEQEQRSSGVEDFRSSPFSISSSCLLHVAFRSEEQDLRSSAFFICSSSNSNSSSTAPWCSCGALWGH